MDVEVESACPRAVALDDPLATEVFCVGGKGASLARCLQVGLPVPQGFCVTTGAYREALASVSNEIVDSANSGNAVGARDLVLGQEMPPELVAAIASEYKRLGDVAVAVRSSATDEDSSEASFAGQHESYLGIRGIAAVLDAVRKCWGSLWSDQAIAYRRERTMSNASLALAVVVQRMVSADTAGVLFTQDPLSGRRDVMVGNASYGLGESVVAGLVTPDIAHLSRKGRATVSVQLGDKATRLDLDLAGGLRRTPVAPALRLAPAVSDAQWGQLRDLGERVEAHSGAPQDVEWAFAGDSLFLLQSRPITTPETPMAESPTTRGRIAQALRTDLVEHFPAPYPLDLCAVHAVQGAVQELMCTAGLRAPAATSLVVGDEDGVVRVHMTRPRLSWALATRLPTLIRLGVGHDAFAWADEEHGYQEVLSRQQARASRLCGEPDQHVMQLLDDAIAQVSTITTNRMVRYVAPTMVDRIVLARFLRRARLSRSLTPEDLLSGISFKSAEITADFGRLSESARNAGLERVILDAGSGHIGEAVREAPASEQFRADVERFLRHHGARTGRLYLPFSNRSWREDPETLYSLLAATLRGAPLELAPRLEAEDVEQRLPRRLRARWRSRVAQLRARHVAREGSVYLIEEFFCVARVAMDEAVKRLVARGQVRDVNDARFLYLAEVKSGLNDPTRDFASTTRRRAQKRGIAEAAWWGESGTSRGSAEYSGLASSAGIASGPARIVLSPDDFALLKTGDILVCPYTDPTWTPLFALAAGVVAETGGPLSHAAIVAREYGIPAVLGVRNATSIPADTFLAVDGRAGTVKLVDVLE